MKPAGWSLTELLIGLAIFSVVMVGVYQYSLRATRVSTETIETNLFERNAQNLKRVLEQKLKNMGFNPMLVPYQIDEACELPPSPFSPHRIGLAAAEPFRLLYTSDDNILFKPDPDNTDGWTGSVQNAEKYGFWAAASETSPPISWTTLINQDGELCEPVGPGAFGQVYKLYHRVKNADASNYLTDSTIPAALADNVICFEVRYYGFNVDYLPGSNLPLEKEPWRRVWDGASNYESPDIYKMPSMFNCAQPEAYTKYIRDSIRLIRVGVVLVAPKSKTETATEINPFTGDDRKVVRLIMETRLANNPWLPESLVAPDGSAICLPSRPSPLCPP